MAIILDGLALAKKIKMELKEKIMYEKIECELVVVLVGDDEASKVYVANKAKDCNEVGIKSRIIRLESDVAQADLLTIINDLNEDKNVNGILVQLPLPNHIDEAAVISAINPVKDVDGFHLINVGKLWTGSAELRPCTPAGIMEFLKEYEIEVQGKECVVVGRSNIVGKPMAAMLLNANGTVTITHSKTKNLAEATRRADILVVAIGKANFITADMVKDGAVVIDVGMNRLDGKLVGDVDFVNVEKKASYITPVPGGVGPMTRAELLRNVVKAVIG